MTLDGLWFIRRPGKGGGAMLSNDEFVFLPTTSLRAVRFAQGKFSVDVYLGSAERPQPKAAMLPIHRLTTNTGGVYESDVDDVSLEQMEKTSPAFVAGLAALLEGDERKALR